MPYDPTLPINGEIADADEMRAQFNGLDERITGTNERIDNIPAGPQGEKGDKGDPGETGAQGLPFASAVVDGTSTLGPGEAATVSSSFDGSTVHFSFGIPQGQPGATGADGAQGLPFASAIVDGVSTLNPGEAAFVNVSFDGSNVHFSFGIPLGAQGVPGEVSAQQLTDAVATTAKNPASFPAFTGTFSDPVTQAEMQNFAAYVESWRQFMSR
ncbi:MAG: hypothetical protein ABMA13_17575 [Chthoniobacteraceae bacterium]